MTRLSRFKPVARSRLQGNSDDIAPMLLGRFLVRTLDDGTRLVVRIVEVEAYLGMHDRASHCYNGHRTPRVESMYGVGGTLYVYFTYGMHHCMNIVTGPRDVGQAVLLRAAEGVEGIAEMVSNRKRSGKRLGPRDLAGGPGKLCQALGIDRGLDGHDLRHPPLVLTQGEPVTDEAQIVRGPRVGLGECGDAKGWPLRFAIKDHPEVSRPRI